MKKKIIEGVDVLTVEKKVLSPILIDFGREDLNLLRDTLNEVVAHLNA